ncbi:MAG: hypothetical protein HC905_02935 [Bacteroidales bacterium]|nr:hypothetical protein [Bacteroidales bacterium]
MSNAKYDSLENDNVYAFNIKDDVIFIADAESGRKGYYCIGCRKEMQAVKSDIQGRKQFFRHDPKFFLTGEKKCYYSDESYRHKLAKDFLQKNKRIKVPPVYNFPPPGIKGKAVLLSESRFIEADSAEIELSFYEDENGRVQYGRNDVDEKNLLIRPDVAFFNGKGNPILLIEIVVTHKIKQDKYIKIKRLGIDTVQVIIPKDSPEKIEKSLETSSLTKWIYNNEQESTIYIPITESSSERILPFDEEPKRVFTETVSCREFQIRELIRRIKGCLESGEYRGVKQNIGSELSRIKGITETLEEQWRILQEGIRREIQGKYRNRRETIDREETEIRGQEEWLIKEEDGVEKEEGEFDASIRTGIKERIRLAKSELGEKERKTEERFLLKRDAFVSQINSLRVQIGTTERNKSSIEGEIRIEEREINTLQSGVESLRRQIENLPNLEEECRGFIQSYSKTLDEVTNDIKREEGRTGELRKKIEGRIAGIREEIEKQYRGEEERIVESIKTRDFSGDSEFAKLGEKYSDALRLFEDWSILADEKRRVSKGKDCIIFGTYKDWHD